MPGVSGARPEGPGVPLAELSQQRSGSIAEGSNERMYVEGSSHVSGVPGGAAVVGLALARGPGHQVYPGKPIFL